MLPRERRLTSEHQFQMVFGRGKAVYSKTLTAHLLSTGQKTRIGFSVGQKFSKKAVERNRAKRLLQEAVKQNRALIKEGFDVVVVVRRGMKIDSLGSATRDLLGLFRKAELLTNEKKRKRKIS